MSGYSGIILAGGDGRRLSSLTVAPADPVVGLPSDHYVSDDEAFMARVEGALEAVGTRSEVVVLLGVAQRLEQAGCLWNSFVIVAQPSTLEEMIRRATPELFDAFAPIRARLGTPWEDDAARAVYGRLLSTDLSRHVFQACSGSLAVLPVSGVGWNDLGDPTRVQATQERIGGELVRA